MKQHMCMQCLADSTEADTKGFIQNLRMLQNGIIYYEGTKRRYDLDELVIDTLHICVQCMKTTYLITTSDGIKGQATEYWEN